MAEEQLQRPERNCVEVARNLSGFLAVRDSKDPDVGRLVAPREAWQAFMKKVRV
jgi:hypothetical protein